MFVFFRWVCSSLAVLRLAVTYSTVKVSHCDRLILKIFHFHFNTFRCRCYKQFCLFVNHFISILHTLSLYLFDHKSDRPWPVNLVFDFVNREEWGAQLLPTGHALNNSGVLFVLLYHTGSRGCDNFNDCKELLRQMQVCLTKKPHATFQNAR